MDCFCKTTADINVYVFFDSFHIVLVSVMNKNVNSSYQRLKYIYRYEILYDWGWVTMDCFCKTTGNVKYKKTIILHFINRCCLSQAKTEL